MKKRRIKLPIRLKAKPTKPHSTKKGARGYSRTEAKALLREEARQAEDQGRNG
ncbi:MAG: hypothetical protein AB1555_06570 [Nitrospirota bacterium]